MKVLMYEVISGPNNRITETSLHMPIMLDNRTVLTINPSKKEFRADT